MIPIAQFYPHTRLVPMTIAPPPQASEREFRGVILGSCTLQHSFTGEGAVGDRTPEVTHAVENGTSDIMKR